MLSIRNFTKQLSLISQIQSASFKISGQRNLFTPAYFAIDSFERYTQYLSNNNQANFPTIRKAFQDTLSKPEGKFFTEDLKTFLYLTKDDADYNILIDAIKRYTAQDASSIFNFNFEAPLMRSFYVNNKSDKALELYMDENPNFFNKNAKVGLMLMNKLCEEKRFSEAQKLYHRYIENFKKGNIKNEQAPERIPFYMDFSRLYSEALAEINTPESLKEAKEYLAELTKSNMIVFDQIVMFVFMLAIKQNDAEFAYELASRPMEVIKESVSLNFKIISLSLLNRADDAMNIFTQLATTDNSRIKQPFFSGTIETLRDAINKSGNAEKQTALNELIEKITAENKIKEITLKDFIFRVQDKRQDINTANNNNYDNGRPNRQFINRNDQNYNNYNNRDGYNNYNNRDGNQREDRREQRQNRQYTPRDQNQRTPNPDNRRTYRQDNTQDY